MQTQTRSAQPNVPSLGIPGFSYADLHDPVRLQALTEAFDQEVRAADPELFARYTAHRGGTTRLTGTAESDLLLSLSAHLSRFVGRLFGVEDQLAGLKAAAGRDAPLFRVKRDFVQRRVLKKGWETRPREPLAAVDAQVQPLLSAALAGDERCKAAVNDPELLAALFIDTLLEGERALQVHLDPAKPGALDERAFGAWRKLAAALQDAPLPEAAVKVRGLVGAPSNDELAAVRALLDLMDRWLLAQKVEGHHHGWVLLRFAHPLNFEKLVPLRRPQDKAWAYEGHAEHQRRRDGFELTDPRMEAREVRSEIDYCVICHEREKDSCSSGFRDAKPSTGRNAPESAPFKKNPLGIPLTGCPLEERISEMHAASGTGDQVGALALIAIDNPMCPGTGHRICNDCMKACIYQKQEPVNIPQIETRVLADVLRLHWGFEIWSLLTRWNPLRCAPGQLQTPRAPTGLSALVVGLGPAGYTLAHHLANEGFLVIGVDGLKIEPIPPELTGRAPGQNGVPQPIEWLHEQFGAALDKRITSGFGGVSEYGITVRWDKSFLDVLHLNLARRANVRVYGGTRFGGTLTVDEAFEMGFDHVALAAGAGKPTIIGLKNNLIRGIRKASDFLMALQLSGALKDDTLSNLQVRLPAVVIGGGLTGIDTATELAAYYPRQVERMLLRHEEMVRSHGETQILSLLDNEERAVFQEYLAHGREVRKERERARLAGERPDFAKLVRQWGGVTLAYRKGLNDSPAYRLNHEEIAKALEEGIFFGEGLSPLEAVPDAFGAVQAIRFARQALIDGKWKDANEVVELPARTVCVAAGTSPNITLEKEAPGQLELDSEYGSFKPYKAIKDPTAPTGVRLEPAQVNEDLSGEAGFFTSWNKDGRLVSFFGDNHPTYAGSVVKAMASAKDGFPHISALFADKLAAHDAAARKGGAQYLELVKANRARQAAFAERLDDELLATVHAVNRLTPTIVEVVVRAKAAARRFQPGQFYRLQNFEALAPLVKGTRLSMEGLALTGAWVDREAGLLSMIVLEMGSSSRLVSMLRPGEPVVVMGPTGAPSTIPKNEDVVLCGGGLGNAVLFSIGKALRSNGCRVVYFAGYRQASDVFKREDIEDSADVVVWAVDKNGGAPPEPRRAQDRSFVGNMVEAMVAYCNGQLGEVSIPFTKVERIIAIGSDRMMAAVAAARHNQLKDKLPATHVGIASINSPMQCMMKEICAQCLQKHRDPVTGKETVVFTCFDQDQEMDRLDWENLRARLRGNSLQEKLSALWLEHVLQGTSLPRV